MWLFTKYGFYSIVNDYNDDNLFHCRARKKEDLKILITNCNFLKSIEIHHDINADYRYRIIINQKEFSGVMETLNKSINYSNFKDQISQSESQREKNKYYYEIWAIMKNIK